MAQQTDQSLSAKDISRLTSAKTAGDFPSTPGDEDFRNRALFADHFLMTRLRDDSAWRDNPAPALQRVKSLMEDAHQRWLRKPEQVVRQELYEPLFDLLGFQATVNTKVSDAHTSPDYLLSGLGGNTAAFIYAWDRRLDGPDLDLDEEAPEANPGACVITALEEGVADWIIVTNGRQWRLYSRHAHCRATNFYEVDLAEALTRGETDPNEAFRFWWLFFRAAAFASKAGQKGCWLDSVAQGSRHHAKEIGERLKNRIFIEVFPHLAQGFLEDGKRRRETGTGSERSKAPSARPVPFSPPSDEELTEFYEATLTLLYRLLFLLYAESRDLLPIRDASYREASLKRIEEEIAEKAGTAESEAAARLAKAYSVRETTIYDRLSRLCAAVDRGEPTLNVPIYNGGLFSRPPLPPGEGRGEGVAQASRLPDLQTQRLTSEMQAGRLHHKTEHRIARFLAEHKVPDRYLAPAIDRLARDLDDKTFSPVFIDYRSLDVRHLGSIYEGLLEFRLKIAEEDLTTKSERRREKYIPLAKAKPKRGKQAEVVVRKGHVYLSTDKAERKASGSYYTPEPIVEYIVGQTVGPVLAEKLEQLQPEFRKAQKTFDRQMANLRDARIQQHSAGSVCRTGHGAGSDGGLGLQRGLRQEAADRTYDAHRELVDALFDFRTLDPAMGSGHFLVEAVDFITDRMLAFLNQFPVNPVRFMLDRTRRNILEALGEQGVTVDPDKLTEVKLLKRHVLKRCIFGVDLDPMAVELAKVTLWLDAFTIGAPLSLLDHHLRCGNSLIGATFKDLEAVTQPTAQRPAAVPGMDDAGLLEAAGHVIQVSQMADATATEARQSAREHGAAREELSGYQVALDLLAATHFGCREAADLLKFGSELDFSSRDRLVASLAEAAPSKKGQRPAAELAAEVELLAKSRDLRFFHWELEFPELFFALKGSGQRRTRLKSEIVPGSAGFDCVVGNPPYLGVRTGSFRRAFAGYAIRHYQSARRNWDVFALFIEASLRLVRRHFSLGLIVPSRLSTNRDFAPLRQRVFALGGPAEIIECGEAFDDPSVLASIVIVRAPPDSPSVRMGRRSGNTIAAERSVRREVLQDLPDQPFFTPLSEEQLLAFVSLSKAPVRLGAIAEITRGMECGKNDPHVRATNGRGTRPVISGEGVREFLVAPQGLYMPANLEPASKYKPHVFASVPRLLLRFVAPYPIAAVDRTGVLNFNTVYNVVLHSGGLDEYAALACLLNSNTVRWWFTSAFNASESLFPHIQKYQLADIPLPVIDLSHGVIRRLAAIGRAAIEGRRFRRDEMERLSLEALGASESAPLIPSVDSPTSLACRCPPLPPTSPGQAGRRPGRPGSAWGR